MHAVAAPAPTLAEIGALPPERAGALVLVGKTHGPVVEVHARNMITLLPPGLVELDLVESPRADMDGRVRRRWRATFRHELDRLPEAARLTSAYPMEEVALALRDGCALAALETLRQLVEHPEGVEVTCRSAVDRTLCTDARTTLSQLTAERVWAVSGKPGAIELWLGTPGQVVTIVRPDPARPRYLDVSQEIPLPF